MNDEGLALLKEFEGCRLRAYRDVVGILTIGFGHTGKDVKPGMEITREQAEELLRKDLERFEAGVDACVEVEISESQFAALVCFAYNVGLGNFRSSTLLKLVNEEDFDGAAEQFQRWCRAGGVVVPGLLRRRAAEKALFLKA